MHPQVARILDERQIADYEAFLSPSYDTRPDPFLMKDMDRAVARILRAIENKEVIAVWHDYDCDGVPGGALLHDFFTAIGYTVRTYVPERSEGYGLNEAGLKQLRADGVSLVITVDCGITDIEKVAYANELGMDVIVTDHHIPFSVLPEALAVLNPHRFDDEYPFKELCGTGVAFKLVEGLIARLPGQGGSFGLVAGFEKWLLDLVALATVADMVPLTGENRTLVKFGLLVARKGRRPGLKALFALERVPLASITEDDLAFSIAPKINAASRMSSPRLAFELLTTTSARRAEELAIELVALNKERKLEGMQVAKEVKRRIEAMPALGNVIVLGSHEWRPSLLGIAATSVIETHKRTVCLWGQDGELIKGSCRSDGSVNIVSLMREASDVFTDFGGHELSGGFSVSPERIHELEGTLLNAMARLEETSPARAVGNAENFFSTLPLAEADENLYEALRELAPFGKGNPKPVFRFTDVRVEKLIRFGKSREHVKLVVSDSSGAAHEAISFFVSRAPFSGALGSVSQGSSLSLDASLEASHFRNKKELRLRILNIYGIILP